MFKPMFVKAILVSVGIGLMFVLLALVLLQINNRQAVSQTEQMLYSSPTQQRQFSKTMIADLPEPVQRYFLHAIAPETPLSHTVKLDMKGQFRLAEDQPWLPMQAKEVLSRNGFVWRAVIGSGLSQFQGADYYFNRSGRMQFAILGLVPVVNAESADTARSAIGRFVAELMWLPSALLPQQDVQWKAIDNHTIQAHLKVDDEPITLTLMIDDQGKVIASYALRWGNYTEDRSWKYIPMGGKCYAERTFAGYTIPSQFRAGWWFGTEQYFEFFQGEIEQVELRDIAD